MSLSFQSRETASLLAGLRLLQEADTLARDRARQYRSTMRHAEGGSPLRKNTKRRSTARWCKHQLPACVVQPGGEHAPATVGTTRRTTRIATRLL